ncbi:MAG: formylglycine-generating enzyme family protein [Gammaproteobacteria bacterium]|nr:MAG: formylglycine-generating enzyme family protein [Gammaproteobacteria bacterium]
MVEKGWTYSIETKLLPGQVFTDRLQDGSSGPEMVVIPAGQFRMGDIQGGGSSDEKPVHRVNVEQFAMGKYEVTFAEYDKFAQATRQKKPSDEGWGRGNRPVINVSWHDAVAYVEWLTQQTGKQYRLPTEAEWEYAARAGTDTKYWWGNDIGSNKANCNNSYCKDRFEYTSPVGSFNSNPFDLYDTVGNVWEWTCSEYENKYNGKEKKCTSKNRAMQPVVRDGSWSDVAGGVRTADRGRNSHDYRDSVVGFRLARINL